MEYVMKGKNVVGMAEKLNLNHMELPDDSGESFYLSVIAFQEMFTT
jgi:hypothetical protein